jgi:hypothetical protein
MRNPFISILGRLSVGKKLLLIYLLDLTALIYISSILINEKYIAINFARDELRGNAYIATARDGLIDVALVGAGGATDVRSGLPARVTALSAVEQRLGQDMGSAELNAALVKSLGVVAASPPDEMVAAGDALARGRELVNQSKLILDPDLDSYYAMSLIVLRYPELIELVHGSAPSRKNRAVAPEAAAATHARSISFSKGGSMPRPRV